MKCKITNQSLDTFMSFCNMNIDIGFIEKKDFSKEFFEMEDWIQ